MQLALVTSDPVEAIDGADLIIMAVTQPAIDQLSRTLAPSLTSNQVILMDQAHWAQPGRCRNACAKAAVSNCPLWVNLISCHMQLSWLRVNRSGLGARREKALNAAFVPNKGLGKDFKDGLLGIYPYLNIRPDVLYTGLSGANMVVHPVVALRNQEKVRWGEPWALYAEGVTPQVGALMDQEHLATARECNHEMIPIYQFLMHAYPPFDIATVTNTYEWFRSRMRSRSGQVHLEAVPGSVTFNVRLLEEDVPYGIVPLEGLGRMLGVPTPTISMFINEANQLLDQDYRASGRTVEKMTKEVQASLDSMGVQLRS
jgi:opine dehydrogenase